MDGGVVIAVKKDMSKQERQSEKEWANINELLKVGLLAFLISYYIGSKLSGF